MRKLLGSLGRIVVTLAAVAVAGVFALDLWDYYMLAPWTRDGHVRADIVGITPDVSGLVSEVLVRDNQVVHKGDVLLRVDPQRFQLALRQAEASVAAQAATLDQAQRDSERYRQLSRDVASEQRVEQAVSAENVAAANYQQSLVNRDVAALNLARSEIHAAANGIVTNLSLNPGDYVSAGKAVMALVDTDSLRVEGYFEETKLDRIAVGDPVDIRLMGRHAALTGRVESVAGGVEDRERSNGTSLLANVTPTFSWVRLAQRIPVRVALDRVPEDRGLIVGQTATVAVRGDAAASRTLPGRALLDRLAALFGLGTAQAAG
ncbi:hypothetical protein GCM10011390_30060 [Aureimonas endophytica]|uniref:RND family efflux transporter MFP subunit n=1 Tax=Aureimonas endophytica TaxID=2027858 RepID=A0A916ZQE5_9HYPH|nr:HlyD family secretion protein [Aureimonas endophytica]GGE08988.1 hypothetical protein GCM10011390_30060 [Aureimonas endophytica]